MSDATIYEQELYVAIAQAWYQAGHKGLNLDRVLRPFVLGNGFASSVEGHEAYFDLHRVGKVCALLVCSRPWELDGLRKVLDIQGIGRVPRHKLDPVCAWWYPLAPPPNLLGIHYWELGSGIVELKRVSKFDKPLGLQFGRFLTQKRQCGASAAPRRRGSDG